MSRLMEIFGRQFGSPSGMGGKICFALQNTFNSYMYYEMLEVVNAKENDRVLDIGYGNGYFIQKLYDRYHSDIYGIDISDSAMENAVKRNRKAMNEGALHLSVGDCCDIPFEDETFDKVTSINTIYFWKDTVRGLSEIRRVLKKDGVFYNALILKNILEKLPYTQTGFKYFDWEQLVRDGKRAGFRRVCIKEILKDSTVIVMYQR